MTPAQLRDRLLESFPGATVEVRDLTGGGDHYDITVVSDAFEGKRLLQRQRMVNAALADELASGEIHALKMSTQTPE